MASRTQHSRTQHVRTQRSKTKRSKIINAVASPTDIPGNTFYWDSTDAGSVVFSSSNVVEQVINKPSSGVSFPELVTNGTFPVDVSGWGIISSAALTWNATGGGCMQVQNTIAATGAATQTITTVQGKAYRFKAQTIGGTAANSRVIIRDSIGGVNFIDTTIAGTAASFDFQFYAPSTVIQIRLLLPAVNGQNLLWDNISVKQIDAFYQPIIADQATLVSSAINGKSALLFNGTTNFFTSALPVVGNAFTKFATLKFDFTTTNASNILSSPTLNDHSLTVFQQSSVIARFSLEQGNITYDVTNLDIQNTMVITETFDGYQNSAFYINGVSVATSVAKKLITNPQAILGGYNTNSAAVLYQGYIADFGTWTRPLSSYEVGLLYNQQRNKFIVPSDNNTGYIAASGVGQSNEVGFANALSDSIATGLGLNFIPGIRQYRDTNDKTGDSYSQSNSGSTWPPFVVQLHTLSSKKVLHVSCGKTATSIATTSSTNPADRSLDWGSGSTLRSNFIAYTNAMLSYFNKATLDWVVINQGERDVTYMASNPSWTQTLYQAAFLDFVQFIQANYPGVKILIVQTVQARTTGGDTPLNPTEWGFVTTAQQNIAASVSGVFINQSNVGFTITNGNMEPSDGVHYTKAGNLVVGNSCAVQINANL